ncbi:hypothetical protein [Ornithinimicrobium cerasi]|uniref:Glycine zipper n=1 Tax=Ornithinimicrobium cerasi TaxID=2248773 RepID=A0A285VZN3_9MICO|nr:hypothetical protein [Ornithinimicrobium cerasi]SOC58141.1 hypothetical protein SAMN05421879_1236 [Ornithinimicrobium cerasi]
MTVRIDPDGVLAMSGATLAVGSTIGTIGSDITTQIEKVDQWVAGAPAARRRAGTMAETLAVLAGAAREHAIRYVDHERPIEELRSLGYWLPDFGNLAYRSDETVLENMERIARSDEFGAIPLGMSQMLLERYRNFRVHVPRVDVAAGRSVLTELDSLLATVDDVHLGMPIVRRASGLYVPALSDADPRMSRIHSMIDEATYRPGHNFTTDPTLGRPPTWARTGGRALGVAGVGLTLWDVGATQWEHDQRYHPEYSTGERVASTTYSVATEGGGAVAGGLVGAHYGAIAGSFIPIPVVGTVGGALVGGAIGAFVGSKAGKAVGEGLQQAGSAIADGAKDVWNGLFG